MGSKLDQIIATIAIEVAGNHVDEMIAASKAAALEISSDDVANLPDRTSPKITSKAAGVPQFRDSWPNSWFTAILEILCQKGVVGLPALLTLLDRDGFSHQGEIVLRLLRMAAEDLERKAILDRLNAKLPSMHVTQVYDCVREVVFWSERDPLPLKLLRSMATLKVKDGKDVTVGTFIEQFEAELSLRKARQSPQTAADPLDELIVRTVVMALEPDAFRVQAEAAARELGSIAVDQLANRFDRPDLPTLKSRVPATISNHEAAWARAVFEILGYLGCDALPAACSFLDSDDDYVREKAFRLLVLLAARAKTDDRKTVIEQLKQRLPAFHHREIREPVSDLLLIDGTTDDRIDEVFDDLGNVVVKNFTNDKIAIRDIVVSLNVPPRSKKKLRPATLQEKPSEVTSCKDFAATFGQAVVDKDFIAARAMLSSPLRKMVTAKDLATLIDQSSQHSGPPDAFEYDDNSSTLAELRKHPDESCPISDDVTEANFRCWCRLQFLPVEDSDVDACFDWWMIVVDEKGEPKIGYFQVLDPD